MCDVGTGNGTRVGRGVGVDLERVERTGGIGKDWGRVTVSSVRVRRFPSATPGLCLIAISFHSFRAFRPFRPVALSCRYRAADACRDGGSRAGARCRESSGSRARTARLSDREPLRSILTSRRGMWTVPRLPISPSGTYRTWGTV